MGSVIKILTEHCVGGSTVVVHPTWRPSSRLRNLDLAASVGRTMIGLPRSDVIHVHLAENGAFVREGALAGWARLLGNAMVITIHGSGFLAFARHHAQLTARVLRRAHVITCLDEEVLRLVRAIAPQARVELVPNPIVMDDASSCADQTDEVVLFAGLVGHRKGVDVLARAWALTAHARPTARCVIVGPAGDFTVPELERLEVRAPAPSEEIRRLIRTARVVALPSRAEGMPMFLTEAMSAGRPFVSTPVGGIPALAEYGGVLVDVGDHVALADALIALLSNPTKAMVIGDRGRRFCRQTRSVDVLDARFAELYADAVLRSARASRRMRISPSR